MEFSVGAIGVPLAVRVKKQSDHTIETGLASATNKKIYAGPAGGTVTEFTVNYVDAANGILAYVTQDTDDIATEGTWNIQAGFTLGDFVGRTSVKAFQVFGNL